MTPAEAVSAHELHVRKCEHIKARKPCSHEYTIDCSKCGQPYVESGACLQMQLGTTCDACCAEINEIPEGKPLG